MPVSESTLRKVADLIYHELGIVVDRSSSRLLSSKVEMFLLRNRLSEEELLRRLKDRKFFEEFVSVITVNETYFFREKEHLDVLVKLVSKRGPGKVRILSLPCSTGEEPLSIAITLLEHFGSLTRFDIIGVDVDKRAIEMAQSGIYSRRSVSRVPGNLLNRYFAPVNGAFKIKDNIKYAVRYHVGNVFDMDFLRKLGMFDFVFCRNLLIYFDTKKRAEALNNIARIHKQGGYLFISKTETLIGLVVPYQREIVDRVIVYKRV